MNTLKEEKEIRRMLIENYFASLKRDSLAQHFAGFSEDFKTYRGNSENIRDNGLQEYMRRLKSEPPWLKQHDPVHAVKQEDIKITLDVSDPGLASATVWLSDTIPAWLEVFSLRKRKDEWKIFKLRSIPEGGAPP
jgi:hypothetical protein